jgi:serine/threonine-protein kinase
LRSSIADYEVMEMLSGPVDRPRRFRCRAPQRLGCNDPVEVVEVEVPPGRFTQWSDLLVRISGADPDGRRQILEAGPDPDGLGAFVSMEGAPGGSLADASPAPVVPAADGAAAVAGAARGAHGLHEVGLAHGSIGPGSIFRTRRGPVLGPPRLDLPDGFATGASTWAELQCVDPDLLRGEAPSRSSDIWSLGATLHLVLTGRPLYPGLDQDQPVTAVQRVMFTRPELDPSLDQGIRDLIARCLDPDPSRRPVTAAEVARMLTDTEVAG